ncbi:MAG TPA: TIM barrel protein [Chitinophagaceae bacterium]|nr:TIM barrel protein [Chitinophagaceae bacterium]
MSSRRSFLKQSGIFTGGILMAPSLLTATGCSAVSASNYKVGLQLYTVRDAMDKDPRGTLAKVAKIGYKEMEGATYTGSEKFYGMDVATFAGVLKQNGLTMPSSHYALGSPTTKGTILSDWEHAVEDAAQLGLKYMVCAYLPEDRRKTLDDYKKVADELNKAGETCKKHGIQLCYHNHNFEFPKLDGQVPYEVLLKSADKDLVKMEMDIYWITKAGYDPVAMFKEHPGRFELWHVKDMDNTPKHFFTEVGSGVIDWNRIFAHRKESGMKHFFVEQDECPGDPLVSIAKSYGYLEKNIVTKYKPV